MAVEEFDLKDKEELVCGSDQCMVRTYVELNGCSGVINLPIADSSRRQAYFEVDYEAIRQDSHKNNTQPTVEADALNDYNPFSTEPNSQPIQSQSVEPVISDLSTSRSDHYTINMDLERRQKELEAKEAALAQREEEQFRLNQQGSTPSGQGGNKMCPPTFRPRFHDIAVEIIPQYQMIVKYGYYFWAGHLVLLLINVITSFILLIKSTVGDYGGQFAYALIYFVVCIFVSFYCWFRPLFSAFKNNSSLKFFIFFIVFATQLILLALGTLGVFNTCGWITAFTLLKKDTGLGVWVIILALMYTITTVLGVILIKKPVSSGASSKAPSSGVRQRKATSSSAKRPVAQAGQKNPIFLFCSVDSPGIKMSPVSVLVMSLCFIVSVFLLHFWGKYTRST